MDMEFIQYLAIMISSAACMTIMMLTLIPGKAASDRKQMRCLFLFSAALFLYGIFFMAVYSFDIRNKWSNAITYVDNFIFIALIIFLFMYEHSCLKTRGSAILNRIVLMYTAVYTAAFIIMMAAGAVSPGLAIFASHQTTMIYFILDSLYAPILIAGMIVYLPHRISGKKYMLIHSLLLYFSMLLFEYLSLRDYYSYFTSSSDAGLSAYTIAGWLWVAVNIMSVVVVYKLGFAKAYSISSYNALDNDKLQIISSNYDLTQRETEVFSLIYLGKSNEDISTELFISVNTVKVHIRHIYKKMHVKSRIEAVQAVSALV